MLELLCQNVERVAPLTHRKYRCAYPTHTNLYLVALDPVHGWND